MFVLWASHRAVHVAQLAVTVTLPDAHPGRALLAAAVVTLHQPRVVGGALAIELHVCMHKLVSFVDGATPWCGEGTASRRRADIKENPDEHGGPNAVSSVNNKKCRGEGSRLSFSPSPFVVESASLFPSSLNSRSCCFFSPPLHQESGRVVTSHNTVRAHSSSSSPSTYPPHIIPHAHTHTAMTSPPPSSSSSSSWMEALERGLTRVETHSPFPGKSLRTIRTICANVADHPTEAKYRKIRLDNSSFRRKVWDVEGGREVCEALGWRHVPGDQPVVILPHQ